jgi:hypothetical protein
LLGNLKAKACWSILDFQLAMNLAVPHLSADAVAMSRRNYLPNPAKKMLDVYEFDVSEAQKNPKHSVLGNVVPQLTVSLNAGRQDRLFNLVKKTV